MVKLKKITEKSWIVVGESNETKIGLLTELMSKYTLLMRGKKITFLNKQELNRYFNQDVFNKSVETEYESETKIEYYVKGYPVNYDKPIEIYKSESGLPLYSKKEQSDVLYSAGYYCINFPKNWMPSFCPKLSTLERYGYVGPFKTKSEMKSNLTKQRRLKLWKNHTK